MEKKLFQNPKRIHEKFINQQVFHQLLFVDTRNFREYIIDFWNVEEEGGGHNPNENLKI